MITDGGCSSGKRIHWPEACVLNNAWVVEIFYFRTDNSDRRVLEKWLDKALNDIRREISIIIYYKNKFAPRLSDIRRR